MIANFLSAIYIFCSQNYSIYIIHEHECVFYLIFSTNIFKKNVTGVHDKIKDVNKNLLKKKVVKILESLRYFKTMLVATLTDCIAVLNFMCPDNNYIVYCIYFLSISFGCLNLKYLLTILISKS